MPLFGNIVDYYLGEMHDEFELHAAWLPGTRVQLGDVGIVDAHNKFSRKTSLDKKGVSFETLEGQSLPDYVFTSAGGVSVLAKAAGEAKIGTLDVADAGFSIQYSRGKSTVFRANQVLEHVIDDIDSLHSDILEKYKNGKWNEKYVVVTKVIQAESATILISRDSDAQIDLKAETEVPNMNIASIDANFSVKTQKGLETQVVANKGLTPLFEIEEFDLGNGFFDAFGYSTKGSKSPNIRALEKSMGGVSIDRPSTGMKGGPIRRVVPFVDRRLEPSGKERSSTSPS